VTGNCECGNEPSGLIKCGEFLDYLRTVSFTRRTLLHGVSKSPINEKFVTINIYKMLVCSSGFVLRMTKFSRQRLRCVSGRVCGKEDSCQSHPLQMAAPCERRVGRTCT